MESEMKKNNISTNIQKINFKYILDNCTNKELWRQKWNIYEYDGLRLMLTLYSIDIADNKLTLLIESNSSECFDEIRYYSNMSEIFTIPLSKEHYNKFVFKKQLFKTCLNLIDSIELIIMSESDKYEEEASKDLAMMLKAKMSIKYLLNTKNINNENIVRAYVNQNIKRLYFKQYIESWKSENKYKIISSHYLMLALILEDKEKYAEFESIILKKDSSTKNKKNIDLIEIEYQKAIENLLREIEDEIG